MDEACVPVTDDELNQIPPRYWRLARFIVDTLHRRQHHAFTRIERLLDRIDEIQEKIMSDQSKLDADVQALNDGIANIAAEIEALKNQPPAAQLDFTGLDAAVANLQTIETPTPPPA